MCWLFIFFFSVVFERKPMLQNKNGETSLRGISMQSAFFSPQHPCIVLKYKYTALRFDTFIVLLYL